MSKELEIELTFLAASIPKEIDGVEPVYYEDVYIPEDSEFPVLRLRKMQNKYELTKKVPVSKDDFSEHVEHTIPLDKTEYRLMKGISKRRVSKNRYRVCIDGIEAEVDVFDDALKGLVLIDFEFDSEAELMNFNPPKCCLVDVTQEKTILGGQLAGKSYVSMEQWLNQVGYKKLV